MKQRISPYLMRAFKLYDLAVILFSLLISAVIIQHFEGSGSLDEFIAMRLEVRNFLAIFLWLFIWREVFLYFHLYNSKRLSAHSIDESKGVTRAISLGVVIVWSTGYLFSVEFITLDFSVMFCALTLLITLISRFLMRYLFLYVRHWGRNLNYLLVVDSNRRVLEIADILVSDKGLGYIFVGIVDDHRQENVVVDGPFR